MDLPGTLSAWRCSHSRETADDALKRAAANVGAARADERTTDNL